MDVLRRPPGLPLPPLHNLPPHGRPIPARLHRPPHLSLAPPTLSTSSSPKSTPETTCHTLVLPHPPRPHRHLHLPRYRPWQHFPPLHNPDLLHDVQVLRPHLRSHIRLPLPPRNSHIKTNSHHPHHDPGSPPHGLRRDRLPRPWLRARNVRLLLFWLPMGPHSDPVAPPSRDV